MFHQRIIALCTLVALSLVSLWATHTPAQTRAQTDVTPTPTVIPSPTPITNPFTSCDEIVGIPVSECAVTTTRLSQFMLTTADNQIYLPAARK